LQRSLLNLYDEVINMGPIPSIEKIFAIFKNNISKLSIYIKYSDLYNTAAQIISQEKKR